MQLYFLKQLPNRLLTNNNLGSGDSAEGQSDFRTYLARIGVYPTYLNSVTKAAAVIVKDKFSYKGKCDIKEPAYRTFISEVFSYLIEEVNTVMQDIVTYGMAPPPVGSLAALDSLLLYAKEACELNADTLAERYHLEVRDCHSGLYKNLLDRLIEPFLDIEILSLIAKYFFIVHNE